MFEDKKPSKVSISQKYTKEKSTELSTNGIMPFYPQNYNRVPVGPTNYNGTENGSSQA